MASGQGGNRTASLPCLDSPPRCYEMKSAALHLFGGLIDRVLCVLGAVLFSQGPEFMQQYLQRLGGHLQEAQRQLDLFREAATRSGRTLEQFIAQTHTNPDAG